MSRNFAMLPVASIAVPQLVSSSSYHSVKSSKPFAEGIYTSTDILKAFDLVPTEKKILETVFSDPSYITEDELTGVNLDVLAYAACGAISVDEVPVVTYHSDGGFNRLLLLHFQAAGRKVIARVAMRNARDPCRIAPAVATMSFARHVRGMPVPEVYAWNDTVDSAVGAPYMLQEFVEDVVEPWQVFRLSDKGQQAQILDDLARSHAVLLTPLPPHLQGFGDLAFAPDLPPAEADLSDPRSYVLQPLRTRLSRPYGQSMAFSSSSTSLPSVWDEIWQRRYDRVWEQTTSSTSRTIDFEELGLDEDQPDETGECTAEAFSAVAQHARRFIRGALARLVSAPEEYTAACFVRTDYAFRNVLLDASTRRVKALIDWDDVHVVPFVLALNFPEDIARFVTDGMPADAPWFLEGEFGVLPPDEHGQVIGSVDAEGNYTNVDAQGNKTYVDERDERILNTLYRELYVRALSACDERVGEGRMRDVRKEMVKAEELIQSGGAGWWSRRKWLAAQAEES